MTKSVLAAVILLVLAAGAAYVTTQKPSEVAQPETVKEMTPETAVTIEIPKAETPEAPKAEVSELNTQTQSAVKAPTPKLAATAPKAIRRDLPTQVGEPQPVFPAEKIGVPGEVAASVTEVSAPTTGDVQAKITAAQLTGLDNSRAVTELLLGVHYEIDANNAVGLVQEGRKLYEVATGEDEFLLQDTAIYYQCRLGKGLLDTSWILNAGATIPISRQSRDNMLITRPSLSFEISRRFVNDRVRVSIQPFFHYYVNQYATDMKRVPLRKMSLGQQLEVDVAVIPGQMNFVMWGKGYYNVSEEFDDSPTAPAPTTSLEYGSYIGLGLNQHLGAQVGYVKGNSIFKDPLLDSSMSFYDPAASRFYAALEFKF